MFIPDQYKRQQSSMHDNNSRKKGRKSEIYEQIFIGLGLRVFCTICHLLSPVLCFCLYFSDWSIYPGGGGDGGSIALQTIVDSCTKKDLAKTNYQLNICNQNYKSRLELWYSVEKYSPTVYSIVDAAIQLSA